MKRVLLTIIITMLVVAPFVQADSVEGADAVSVGSKNMINIQVVDQFGNNIDFGELTMKDKNGTEYANMNLATGELSTNAPRVMKMGQGFTLYPSDVQKFVTSGTVVGVSSPDMNKATYDYSNMVLENGSNEVRIWYVPDRTDYVLKANTMGLYVDPKWENAGAEAWLDFDGKRVIINENIGLTLYPLNAGTYDLIRWLVAVGTQRTDLVIHNNDTEFVKVRIKLSDIDSKYNSDGTYRHSDSGVNTQIAGEKKYKSAAIFFVSDGMITVPVPDAEGYVEVYVSKRTGTVIHNTQSYIGIHYSGLVRNIYCYPYVDMNLQPQAASNSGVSLMGVEEGKYTVAFESNKSEYASMNAQVIDVKNSDDIQTITITVHKHDYSEEFKANTNEHWKECSCRDKKDIKTHVFDNSKYSFDEKAHWYQCEECNYKLNETEHNYEWVIDLEATEDIAGQKHEECTECGYKKESVEIPQIIVETEVPTEPDTTIAPTEAETEKETEAETEPRMKDNNNWIWIVVGIGVFVAVTTIILIILIKKKKKKEE